VIRHKDGRAARRRESGQALVLFALSLTGLLALAGLVVDFGGAWSLARTEQ
jgi:Flp pilus assembly protein TadG